jgi:hypothetical protein
MFDFMSTSGALNDSAAPLVRKSDMNVVPATSTSVRLHLTVRRAFDQGSEKILVSAARDREDRLYGEKEAVVEWVLKLEARSGWGDVETIEVAGSNVVSRGLRRSS